MKKIILTFVLGLLLSSNLNAQWTPTTPIYVHSNEVKILESNPNLYSYRHLTNHYFYNKPGPNGEVYDTRSIDPRRFKEQYLENDERRFRYDVNHPWMTESMILDLEMNPIWRIDDPEWDRWTQDYINIMRMTKSAGKQVAAYGVYMQAEEFQVWWNLGRYRHFLNPELNAGYSLASSATIRKWQNKLKEYQDKETRLLEKFSKLGERFNSEIDACVIEMYFAYDNILSTSERHWPWYAWKSVVESKIAAYQLAFPGKPIYVFIQPNFTVGWKPVPLTVWNQFITELSANPDVDRIYLFNIQDKQKTQGWDSVIIEGPQTQGGNGKDSLD